MGFVGARAPDANISDGCQIRKETNPHLARVGLAPSAEGRASELLASSRSLTLAGLRFFATLQRGSKLQHVGRVIYSGWQSKVVTNPPRRDWKPARVAGACGAPELSALSGLGLSAPHS
jgi:hypothetical protein